MSEEAITKLAEELHHAWNQANGNYYSVKWKYLRDDLKTAWRDVALKVIEMIEEKELEA